MLITITEGWNGREVARGEILEGKVEVVTATGREDSYSSPEELLVAYPPSMFWVLSAPDHWELARDPFHPDAFKGTPAEGLVAGAESSRSVVWLATDYYGNAVGIAGVQDLHPPPPGHPYAQGEPRELECEVCEQGFLGDSYQEEPVCPKCQRPVARVMLAVEGKA